MDLRHSRRMGAGEAYEGRWPSSTTSASLYVGLGPSNSVLYKITAEDVDTEQKLVRLPGTKTRARERWVPLPPDLLGGFERLIEEAEAGEPLFESWSNVRRDLLKACGRLGIEPVSPNDLRRTFAIWAERGVPELVVVSLMGHSNSAMVRRVYAQLGRPAHHEAIQRLPALGAPSGAPATVTVCVTDSAGKGATERAYAGSDARARKAKTPRKAGSLRCPEAESNRRHGDFQSPALPTELSGRPVGEADNYRAHAPCQGRVPAGGANARRTRYLPGDASSRLEW